MTRKDYELIAKTIKTSKLFSKVPEEINKVARAFVGPLTGENPRFNKDKFLEACGVEN